MRHRQRALARTQDRTGAGGRGGAGGAGAGPRGLHPSRQQWNLLSRGVSEWALDDVMLNRWVCFRGGDTQTGEQVG